LIEYCLPIIFIHMHRALWICPAIILTVRRGAPGIFISHSSSGSWSKKNSVTRLFVCQAANSVAPGRLPFTAGSYEVMPTSNLDFLLLDQS
jgi:hypothetical protein